MTRDKHGKFDEAEGMDTVFDEGEIKPELV